MRTSNGKCLVVVLCQTREAKLTKESLKHHVLQPLGADLLLFVSDQPERDTAFDELAKYIALVNEPPHWTTAFDTVSGSSSWRKLLDEPAIGKDLLGGAVELGAVGSGGIIMWFRVQLERHLQANATFDAHSWICIIRSDYLWEIDLPAIDKLSDEYLYLLNEEGYGGYSDRFILFNRQKYPEVLKIANSLFSLDSRIEERLSRYHAEFGYVNPEIYIKSFIEEKLPNAKISLLPQPGWAIRSIGGSTRWSQGHFSEELGIFVKYPNELLHTKLSSFIFRKKINHPQGRIFNLKFRVYLRLSRAMKDDKFRRYFWKLIGMSSLENQ